ncbi:hypothetical protein EBZ57_00765 [bacterium]|nr:hypothetical protein [bacterium]
MTTEKIDSYPDKYPGQGEHEDNLYKPSGIEETTTSEESTQNSERSEGVNKLLKYYVTLSLTSDSPEMREMLNSAESEADNEIDHETLFKYLTTQSPDVAIRELMNEVVGTRKEKIEKMNERLEETRADYIAKDTEDKFTLLATKKELLARANELESVYKDLNKILNELQEYNKKNSLKK